MTIQLMYKTNDDERSQDAIEVCAELEAMTAPPSGYNATR